MRQRKIKIDFSHLPVPVLLDLARFIIVKMTGNASYPTPDPTIVEVKSLADDLEDKAALALDGGRQAVSDMNTAKDKLCDALYYLGLYVLKTAKGNENVLVSSGYPLTKDPIPWHRDELEISHGPNSGDLMLRYQVIDRARAYIVQYFLGENPPADNDLWKLGGARTQTKMDLHNLPEGEKVWIRYCAVTPEGMTGWCEPRHFIVG